ncbi:Haemagluttinin repeat-containing protein, partial [[Haemophilus] ducreyi]
VIFAEDDINILTNEGDSKLNKIHADYVRVVGKDIELADKGLLFGKEQLILNTTGNIKLKNASSVISNKNLGIKAANITLDNATVSADNLSFRIKNDAKLSNSSKVSALVADVKSGNLALDNSSLSVNKLTLNITKDVMLNKASKLSAKEIALNVTNNITLNGTSKLSAGKANIKTANLTLNGDNSSLVAEKLDINATNKITNNGTIAGITANITTNALENKKDAVILAHKNLNFTVNGSDYVNKGDIISKDKATLTFSNNSDFISNGSKLVDAQNNLTVNVNNFNISQKGDEITLHGKVKLNVKGNFTNHGNLITVQELDIGEVQNFTNTGNLTVGKNLDIHSNTAVKNDGKLVTIETLNISSKTDFFNNGTMIGLEALKIASGGNFTNASNGTLASNKTLDIGGNNFTNNGTIESVKSLNITNNDTFINNATIQSYGVLNITTTGNFTNESNGTVMSHRVLNITAQQDNITNKNLIAGGAGLNLTAVKGNISNKSEKNTAVLHSLGNIMLDANNTVYNLGEIYSQAGNITFDAQKLHNDVKLSGQVGVKLKNGSAEVKSDSYNPGSFLTSFQHPSLEIVGNFADLDNSLKIDSRGKIYAGNSLNFKKKNGGNGNIINRGTINVINKLSYDSGVNVENNMVSENVDLYQKIFKADNTIKLEIKGNNSVTFRDNPKQHKSGSTPKTKEFKNLEELISAAFDGYNGSSIEEATIPTPYYLIALAQAVNNTNGEGYLKTALQYIFGQNWQDLLSTDQNRLAQINHKWNELKTKWNKFKENGNKTAIKLNLYPTDNGVEKAKVFAGVLENSVVNGQEYEKLNNEAKEKYKDKYKKKFQSVFKKFIDTNEDFKGRFQNGEFDWAGEWAKDDKEKGNYDSTKANEKYESIKKEGHTVNIGKHEIKVPGVSFENLNNINHQQDKSDGIDK